MLPYGGGEERGEEGEIGEEDGWLGFRREAENRDVRGRAADLCLLGDSNDMWGTGYNGAHLSWTKRQEQSVARCFCGVAEMACARRPP